MRLATHDPAVAHECDRDGCLAWCIFGGTQQVQPGPQVTDNMVWKRVLSDMFLVRPVEYDTKYKFSSIIQNKAWYDVHGHQLQMSLLAKQT